MPSLMPAMTRGRRRHRRFDPGLLAVRAKDADQGDEGTVAMLEQGWELITCPGFVSRRSRNRLG